MKKTSVTRRKSRLLILCMLMLTLAVLASCQTNTKQPIPPSTSTESQDNLPVQKPSDSQPSAPSTNATDENTPSTNENTAPGCVLTQFETLDAALQALDATICEENHPNIGYAEDFANAIIENNTYLLAEYIGQDVFYTNEEGFALFGGTEFEGYEIFPILLPEKYSQPYLTEEDYLLNLKVISTDSPAFGIGNNFMLLRSPAEYSLSSLENPSCLATDAAFDELDDSIRVIVSAMNMGVDVASGSTPASRLSAAKYIHDGLHRYGAVFGEKELYSLNEINHFLTEHINGLAPLTATDLTELVNTVYFYRHPQEEPTEITADTPLYGCSAGHGSFLFSCSYAGAEYSKNDITVSFYLYADPMRIFPAARTDFVFDISGDEPVLLSVERQDYPGFVPFSYQM